ncbi:hypothetical protein EW146_g6330, partial [Bondarzewia mesenterica]
YLFGAPVPTETRTWSAVRRVVAGRLVNGYAADDYVLAVLSRASDARWEVAGLQEVDVQGVENVLCDGVDGHLKWRGMVGKCLEACGAPGINKERVERQMRSVAKDIGKAVDMNKEEVEQAIAEGPVGDDEQEPSSF